MISKQFALLGKRVTASAVVGGMMLAGVTLMSTAANAYTINYALTSEGATFDGASSELTGNGINNAIMESDLLTNSKVAWYYDGDTRFTFGANDPNAYIEINLGQVRDITDIGTTITQNDRPTIGPISIEVSTNGTTWTDWGSPVDIATLTSDTVDITEAMTGVQFIKYIYGPSGDPDNGFGGSAVASIFADVDPVPLPSAWSMAVVGLIGIGFLAYRGKSRSGDPFAAA